MESADSLCSAIVLATPHRLNPETSGFLTLSGPRHPNSGVSRKERAARSTQ